MLYHMTGQHRSKQINKQQIGTGGGLFIKNHYMGENIDHFSEFKDEVHSYEDRHMDVYTQYEMTHQILENKELSQSFNDCDIERMCLQSLMLIGLSWKRQEKLMQAKYSNGKYCVLFTYEDHTLLCDYLSRGVSIFSVKINCLNGVLQTSGGTTIETNAHENIFTHIVCMFVYSVQIGDLGRLVDFITNVQFLTFKGGEVFYGSMCIAKWSEEDNIYLGNDENNCIYFLCLINRNSWKLEVVIWITIVICVLIIVVFGVFMKDITRIND